MHEVLATDLAEVFPVWGCGVPFGIGRENEGDRVVPFDPLRWVCRMESGIDEGPAAMKECATDVKMRVVSASCFAQRRRMYLRTRLSHGRFERAPSHLNSPLKIGPRRAGGLSVGSRRTRCGR